MEHVKIVLCMRKHRVMRERDVVQTNAMKDRGLNRMVGVMIVNLLHEDQEME